MAPLDQSEQGAAAEMTINKSNVRVLDKLTEAMDKVDQPYYYKGNQIYITAASSVGLDYNNQQQHSSQYSSQQHSNNSNNKASTGTKSKIICN